jgi:hypothetical protein
MGGCKERLPVIEEVKGITADYVACPVATLPEEIIDPLAFDDSW